MARAIILWVCFHMIVGFQPELEIFSGVNNTGNSIFYREKLNPNLSTWEQEFITSSQSTCHTGIWTFFSDNNYAGNGALTFATIENSTRRCSKSGFSPLIPLSIRAAGPTDLSIPAISIFESFGNRTEIVITSPAANNFGFVPSSALITGHSNYTVFSNADFTGNTTCLRGTKTLHEIKFPNLPKFSSLIKGCDLSEGEIKTTIASIDIK